MARQKRPPRFGAPVRWTLRVVALVVVVWLVASVVVLLQARSSAISGLDRLDAVREELTATELLRGGGRAHVAVSASIAHQMNSRLRRLHLSPRAPGESACSDTVKASVMCQAQRAARVARRVRHG